MSNNHEALIWDKGFLCLVHTWEWMMIKLSLKLEVLFLVIFSFFFLGVFTNPSQVSAHHHLSPFTFFHLPSPTSLQQSPYCYPCPCTFPFFLFCSIPHPPPHLPLRVVHLLSIYESVSILPVSSFYSLDSTHEWNNMVLVLLWLAYFS